MRNTRSLASMASRLSPLAACLAGILMIDHQALALQTVTLCTDPAAATPGTLRSAVAAAASN